MFFAIKKDRDFITLSNLCKTILIVLVYFYIALNYSCLICSNLFSFASTSICFKKFQGLYPKTKFYTKFKTNPPLVCIQQNFLLLMFKKFLICYHFLVLMLHFYVNSSNSVTLSQFWFSFNLIILRFLNYSIYDLNYLQSLMFNILILFCSEKLREKDKVFQKAQGKKCLYLMLNQGKRYMLAKNFDILWEVIDL